VREVAGFHAVYHSSRYVRDLLVLRLRRALPTHAVAELGRDFRDIVSGPITQRDAFPVERDDPEAWHLPRLAFRFDRVHFGRLRMLIDRVNEAGES
jgi:hypothetical protein